MSFWKAWRMRNVKYCIHDLVLQSFRSVGVTLLFMMMCYISYIRFLWSCLVIGDFSQPLTWCGQCTSSVMFPIVSIYSAVSWYVACNISVSDEGTTAYITYTDHHLSRILPYTSHHIARHHSSHLYLSHHSPMIFYFHFPELLSMPRKQRLASQASSKSEPLLDTAVRSKEQVSDWAIRSLWFYHTFSCLMIFCFSLFFYCIELVVRLFLLHNIFVLSMRPVVYLVSIRMR